jgi:hypothetical protein
MRVEAAVLLACSACGRIAFDPLPDANVGCRGGSRVAIDEFSSGLASPLRLDAIGSTQIRETNLAGVLGGARTVTLFLTATGPVDGVSVGIVPGVLTFSSGPQSDGAVEFLYDGSVFDFSECGTTAVTAAQSDIGFDFTLELTDAAGQTAQLGRSGPATTTAFDVTLSLSDPVFAILDRAHITQIVIRLDGPVGADFAVSATGAN